MTKVLEVLKVLKYHESGPNSLLIQRLHPIMGHINLRIEYGIPGAHQQAHEIRDHLQGQRKTDHLQAQRK